ncbi:hypothetical protein Syun_012911 [Stephania yunnanensis]|uniref:Methyltransferase n=1 Tax=Stephania yunnanensis TaxID=152371 RepID=A0AAP0K0D9_9MAGN
MAFVLQNFKAKHMKTNTKVFSLVTVTLCSIFYIIGLYQHTSTPFQSTTTTTKTIHKCSVSSPNSTDSTNTQFPASPVLDFSTHHSLDHQPNTQIAKQAFPICDAELSEYTPCEDLQRSLKYPRERLEYRERHCPEKSELLRCRVAAPYGYRGVFAWPLSRDFAWYANAPHKHLTVEKAGQNWIKFEGDRFRFPGGGTMFPNGADAYIDEIGKLVDLGGGEIRTAIDTGCGVASWGAYLLSRNILTMSFAPKDSHEAQVQFALERGVPALIGVIATKRLPYPSRAFDMAHCSRCLIPWAQHEGQYLVEIDRILRPGGYWILSGPPINGRNHWKGWERTIEDLQAEQSSIESVAKSLCWKKIKEKNDIAVWQKPTNHIHCKVNRKVFKSPQFCKAQDPDNAWYVKLETCITPLPDAYNIKETAGGKLAKWPRRLTATPPRIASGSLEGITEEIFKKDTQLWRKRVAYYKSLSSQLEEKGRYRNLLDMNAYLGGFAAAIVDDPSWVMNIVPPEAKINTLGVVYERGLIGTYQNWCEAMSTYPRTYDLLHGDSVFSLYQDRCEMEDILLEMDRILRPEGTVILRDDVDILLKVKSITDGLKWESRITDHEDSPHNREKILFAVKLYWTAPAPDPDKPLTN